MSSRLYKRGARVTVWEPEPSSFFSDPKASNALVIKDLRITFQVTRTTESEPDTCELQITNASEETRTLLHKKPLRVRLEAGYDDDLATIFIGDLHFGQSRLDGTDWVTTMQVADGLRAYKNARVSSTFREGTTVLEALKHVATQMQFALPAALAVAPELSAQYATGITLEGRAEAQLTRLLEPFGYRWCMQHGRLVVLKDTETTGSHAIVVDAASGLIGSPETAAPSKDKKVPLTTVKTFLNDQILPGRLIALTSREHRGARFKVVKTTITGDTHGGDFMNESEVKAL